MCGIAGIINIRDRGPEAMERMLGALRHRGPDEGGTYQGPGMILGQRRLSIIDLEGGRQPIPSEDGTKWVICNGEIYNYQELRAELERRGHRFSTRSDTEVIVHLYEDLGERCVERLRGMFAFAIWDETARTLFAARDPLGQKPFYYVHRGSGLSFASEIKALLAFDPGLAELDPAALDQYLALRLIAAPRSMFRDIRKLPPGHRLRFTSGGALEIERYWDLRYQPKATGSDDDLLDELERRLIECLRLHMLSDVPVGAFMSGGMDSTLVVAMMMRHVSPEPIHTFTVGLPYGQFDEAPYARMVAEQYGTTHHERTMRPSLLDTLPELVWHLDEPSDPLSICTYLIARVAREHVKVVLGGDGGDELFGGYDRYYGNRFADYYALLPQALRQYVLGPLIDQLPDGRWYKSRSHQLKWLHRLSFLRGAERYARSLSYFYFGPRARQALYGPSMQRVVTDFDPEAAVREFFDRADAVETLDRMLYADSQVRLPDHPVMILDRMTMAHGLEARSPFMDSELAQFCAGLPSRLKVRGRSLRYIQTRLARRYLPPALLRRKKQGFSSALPYMLADEYRFLFRTFLTDSHLAREGIYRQAAINELLGEHLSGRSDHGNRLWLLLNSEVWYRMFIESATRDELHGLIRHAAGLELEPATRTVGTAVETR